MHTRSKYKILYLVILAAYILTEWCFAAVAKAEEPAAYDKIRVGYTFDNSYMRIIGEDKYEGPIYNYMEVVASYAQMEPVYVQGTNEGLYEKLLNNEIDVIVNFTRPTIPDSRFTSSKFTIMQTLLYLNLRSTNTSKPWRIATPHAIPEAEFRFYMSNNGYVENTDYVMVPADDLAQERELYANHKVDAYVKNSTMADSRDSMKVPLAYAWTYFIMRADNLEIRKRLDYAAERLKVDAPNFRMQLFEDSYAFDKELVLNEEEKEYLKKKGKLVVLSTSAQKPYMTFENGKPYGIIADVWKRIEKDLGIEIEYRDCTDNKGIFPRFKSGEGDLIADFYFEQNWARQHRVITSLPYINVQYVAVNRKGATIPRTPIVAAARNHNYVIQYVEKMHDAKHLKYYDTIEDCLEAVSDGEADITYVKDVVAQYKINVEGYYRLETDGHVYFSHGTSVGLHRNADPILVRIINKIISHYSPDDINNIASHYRMEFSTPQALLSIVYRYPNRTLAVILLFFAANLGIAWLLLRERNKSISRIHEIEPYTGYHTINWARNNVESFIIANRTLKNKGSMAVFSVSLQGFEMLRDVYHHEVLNSAIRNLIQQIKNNCPFVKEIAVNNDLSRFLFFVITEQGVSPYEAAQALIERNKYIDLGSTRANLLLHIGINNIDVTGDEAGDAIIDKAKTARGVAENRGLDIVVYTQELSEQLMKEDQLSNMIPVALKKGEFKIYLQAKVDMQTKEVVGAEALSRWQSPTLGLVMPDTFIPVMERTGLVTELDFYVLEEVLKKQVERYKQGQAIYPISVNQSALHVEVEGYLDRMCKLAAKYDMQPGMIELEITETAFIDMSTKEKSTKAIELIEALHRVGFSVSMDDFAKGYSSLTTLQYLPVNVIKIDRAMMLQATQNNRAYLILQQIMELATKLAIHVLVEGIETEEQEASMLRLGIRFAQGFKYSRPTPMDTFFD